MDKRIGILVAVTAAALAVSWLACGEVSPSRFVANLATPRSGEREVLPEAVFAVIAQLRRDNVRSFRMSAAMAGNRFDAQPLTEGAYPITVTDEAGVYLSYSSEPLPDGCEPVNTEKGIRIARCR